MSNFDELLNNISICGDLSKRKAWVNFASKGRYPKSIIPTISSICNHIRNHYGNIDHHLMNELTRDACLNLNRIFSLSEETIFDIADSYDKKKQRNRAKTITRLVWRPNGHLKKDWSKKIWPQASIEQPEICVFLLLPIFHICAGLELSGNGSDLQASEHYLTACNILRTSNIKLNRSKILWKNKERSMAAMEAAELHDALLNKLTNAPSIIRKETASKGAIAKSGKLDPIRDCCRRLYKEQPESKKHQTKLKAIRDRVIAYAKENGHSLSYDQFIKTASRWVSDLREAPAE